MPDFNENVFSFPMPVGRLRVNESFEINIYGKMPNCFHRMMARLLLGWRYTETKGDKQ